MNEKKTQHTTVFNEQQEPITNYDFIANKYAESSLASGDYHQRVVVFNLKMLINRVQPASLQPMKYVIDIGCGDGNLTKLLVRDGIAEYVVGIDISKKMIDLAKKATKEESKHFQFHIQDISDLKANETIRMSPLVISTYMLCHAKTVNELLTMLSGIRRLCNGFFVGMLPSPFFPPKEAHKLRKYGWKLTISDHPRDGESMQYVFDADTPNEVTIIDYWYNHETYESMFRKAGFQTFEWITMQIDPEATEEQKIFYVDATEHTICFIAGI